MKKVLLATTALVLTAGVASAEVALSGSAGMGLKYNGHALAGTSKTNEFSYVSLSFGGSVETDSGLTFSAATSLDTENNGATLNDDTTVSVSGAFGTLSMGAVAEADVQGGLGDVGYDGNGIDDLAESLDGSSAAGHDVNYTYSANGFTASVSALVGGKTIAAANSKNQSYAVGVKYTFGSSYVGVGMHSKDLDVASVATDGDTTSVYAGTSMDAFSINAMYSSFDSEAAGTQKTSAHGINVAYTTGAAKISFGYADADTNTAGEKAIYGVGVAYDLGGGASISGGVGKTRNAARTGTETMASLGVDFSF
jgi:outer membrane protein OmpU